jgi:hypothetical protein
MRRARRVDRSAALDFCARNFCGTERGSEKEKRRNRHDLVISGNSFRKSATSASARTISHFEKFKVRSCSTNKPQARSWAEGSLRSHSDASDRRAPFIRLN